MRTGGEAAWAAMALVMALTAGAGAAETLRGNATAKEGDIVAVNGQDVRLYGIDAPDRGQTCENRRGTGYDCFELSRTALERIINRRPVECVLRTGSPVQKLGVCKAEGQDLAALMAATGYALAYRPIALDYAGAEALAMSKRRGLWAGRVEPPWHWRSRQLGNPPN